MKVIVYIFIFFISIQKLFAIHPEWKIVDPIPYADPNSHSYLDIKCADSMNCIILAGKNGDDELYLRRTTDGGETWENIYEHDVTMPPIYQIEYQSKNLIMAACSWGWLVRSTDNGKSWTIARIVDEDAGGVFMFNSKYGVGMTYLKQSEHHIGTYKYDTLGLHLTQDGGSSWQRIKIAPITNGYINNYFSLQMVDTNLVVAFLGAKDTTADTNYHFFLWIKGTPEDFTWEVIVTENLHNKLIASGNCYFINRQIGWRWGGRKISDFNWTQVILKTTDGGISWVTQRDYDNEDRRSVDDVEFLDKYSGMAVGGDNWVLKTMDGGNNWEMIYIDSLYYNNFQRIQMTSRTSAYVLSQDRGIYKYKAGGWTDVPERSGNDGKISIFPNPAADMITIAFNPQLSASFETQIEIYNVLGEQVHLSEAFKATESSVSIDVSHLSPGIYYLLSRIGNISESHPFSIIR